MSNIVIREASVDDASLIYEFIRELAIYEKAEHEVLTSIDEISKTLFGVNATARALICTIDEQAVGYAVYFFNYSTWLGKNGVYLEDVYVSPEYRGRGAGKAMLKYIARIAVDNKCGRFEWTVLDWNKPSIDFYESLGAKPQDEWIIYRLAGDKLTSLAND